ncbi:MAG: hypothetical protein ACJ79W_04800 [Myxococcales bacterium]
MRILAALSLALLWACGDDSGVDCAAVTCGPIAPAILLTVTDARGAPLMAIPTITNVVVAASATGSRTSCTFSNATMERADCVVDADVAGHYALDVGATGYKTQHLDVTVPPGSTGGCCPTPHGSVSLAVALAP